MFIAYYAYDFQSLLHFVEWLSAVLYYVPALCLQIACSIHRCFRYLL